MKLRYSVALCALAAGSLTACFDGPSDGEEQMPAPVTQVPASAGASVQAFVTYIGVDLVAATSETTEPLGTDNVATAPTSETLEPVAVN